MKLVPADFGYAWAGKFPRITKEFTIVYSDYTGSAGKPVELNRFQIKQIKLIFQRLKPKMLLMQNESRNHLLIHGIADTLKVPVVIQKSIRKSKNIRTEKVFPVISTLKAANMRQSLARLHKNADCFIFTIPNESLIQISREKPNSSGTPLALARRATHFKFPNIIYWVLPKKVIIERIN